MQCKKQNPNIYDEWCERRNGVSFGGRGSCVCFCCCASLSSFSRLLDPPSHIPKLTCSTFRLAPIDTSIQFHIYICMQATGIRIEESNSSFLHVFLRERGKDRQIDTHCLLPGGDRHSLPALDDEKREDNNGFLSTHFLQSAGGGARHHHQEKREKEGVRSKLFSSFFVSFFSLLL